jgi:CBS domain containing-hemolysin-like protein
MTSMPPYQKHAIGRATAGLKQAIVSLWVLGLVLALPASAQASFLSPELEDKLAGFLAVVILFIVPVVLIVLFWMVHVLPEKIAHKRHHPQFEAIRTLCLLSLVFGGLLWPLAWLWAYSKPVMYKMAYGTDKLPDAGHAEAYPGEEPVPPSLRDRVALLEDRVPPDELDALRADLAALESKYREREVR